MEPWLTKIFLDGNFGPEIGLALERARRLAASLGHRELGPIHLFLALLREGALQKQLGLSLADMEETIARLPDGGSTIGPLPVSGPTTHKHFLLAAFGEGEPGAAILHRLGRDVELFEQKVRGSRQDPDLLVDSGEPETAWDYLTWLAGQSRSLGRTVLEEMGVRWEDFRSRVEREKPDSIDLREALRFQLRIRLWERMLALENTQRLVAHLAHYPAIVPIFWSQGLLPPNFIEPGPGVRLARRYGHVQVEPLHILVEGLKTPCVLADYADVRRACEERLNARPTVTGPGVPTYSPEAWKVLNLAGVSCLVMGHSGTPLQLALEALRRFDKEIMGAVGGDERDADEIEQELSRLVWGRLIGGPWSVDGLTLGQPTVQLGELSRGSGGRFLTASGTSVWFDSEDRVTALEGTTLADSRRRLFGPSSRLQDAERLVGIGRTNRWARFDDTFLRLSVDIHGIPSAAIRAVPANLLPDF